MDWSKAKNVLLLLFLTLNIFLFINLLIYNRDEGVSRSNVVNTTKILSERGYVLEGELPAESKSYWLEYEKGTVDRKKIAEKLLGEEAARQENVTAKTIIRQGSASIRFDQKNGFTYINDSPDAKVDLSDRTELVRYAREALNELELPFSEYALEDYRSQTDGTISIIFRDRYKGHIILYNEAMVLIGKNGITRLECHYVKVRGYASKVAIVPVYKILLVNLQSVDNAIITDIDLAYKCTLENEDTSASTTPIWRVRFEDGTARYFHSNKGIELLDMEK